MRPVDIEAFYDADERRRTSAEIELGNDWTDQYGVRYELSWVQDTGELYVLREPVPATWTTPFGNLYVSGTRKVDENEVQGMTVTVIGTVGSLDELERAFDGWQQAMGEKDSVAWLLERLKSSGIGGPDDPASPLVS